MRDAPQGGGGKESEGLVSSFFDTILAITWGIGG